MDQVGPQDPPGPRALWEDEVSPATPAPRDLLVIEDPLGLPDPPELREIAAEKESPVPAVCQDLGDLTDHQAIQELQDRRDTAASQASLADEETRERLESLVSQETPAHQVPWAPREDAVPPATEVKMALLDLLVCVVLMVCLDLPDHRDRWDPLAPLESPECPALRESRELSA